MDAAEGSGFAALAATVDELSKVCTRLSRENADLRDLVALLSTGASSAAERPAGAGPARSRPARVSLAPARGRRRGRADSLDGPGRILSRRMIGKALGAAAVGSVGAAALVSAGSGSAKAANGDAITAGMSTTCESATELKFDGSSAPGMIFLVNDTSFGAGGSAHPAAVGGWAGGDVANGVYGFTEVEGSDGVTGQVGFGNSTGNGVHGIAAGTSTLAVFGENSAGTAIAATGITGMKATGTQAGLVASGPAAVRADGSGTAGVGVQARGSGAGGRGGVFSGSAAQVQLSPGSKPTHPSRGRRGDLYADKNGRLWFCKKGGTAATWHQIA